MPNQTHILRICDEVFFLPVMYLDFPLSPLLDVVATQLCKNVGGGVTHVDPQGWSMGGKGLKVHAVLCAQIKVQCVAQHKNM